MTKQSVDLDALQQGLGVKFRNIALLQEALVHRSYLNECPDCGLASNERLEFLGDAVLGLVVAQWLFQRHPDLPEGQLTELRSAVVRRESLARAAQRLGLGSYLLLGRGEESSGGRNRPANLARVFEAVVGAVLVDGGMQRARAFILRHLRPELQAAAAGQVKADSKSLLQQVVQSKWHASPSYTVLQIEGPDHDRRFTVQVEVAGRALAIGTGRSKQAAERIAAQQALAILREENSHT